MTIKNARLLTADDIASRLGIGRNKAYSLLGSGAIQGVVRIGSAIRLPEERLDEFIAAGGTKEAK